MTEPRPDEGTDESVSDYTSALIELRDSLMTLSLAMKDFVFEFDFARRDEVSASSQALLEKMKNP